MIDNRFRCIDVALSRASQQIKQGGVMTISPIIFKNLNTGITIEPPVDFSWTTSLFFVIQSDG
jgi:hypothetical protein